MIGSIKTIPSKFTWYKHYIKQFVCMIYKSPTLPLFTYFDGRPRVLNQFVQRPMHTTQEPHKTTIMCSTNSIIIPLQLLSHLQPYFGKLWQKPKIL